MIGRFLAFVCITLLVFHVWAQTWRTDHCFAAVNYAAGAMLVEDADHTVAWWGVQDACK